MGRMVRVAKFATAPCQQSAEPAGRDRQQLRAAPAAACRHLLRPGRCCQTVKPTTTSPATIRNSGGVAFCGGTDVHRHPSRRDAEKSARAIGVAATLMSNPYDTQYPAHEWRIDRSGAVRSPSRTYAGSVPWRRSVDRAISPELLTSSDQSAPRNIQKPFTRTTGGPMPPASTSGSSSILQVLS